MSTHSESSNDLSATDLVAELRDEKAEPALGAREDFFGETSAQTEQDDSGTGHDPEPFDYAREKAENAAYQFLEPLVEKIDPEALFADPDYSDAPREIRLLAETLEVGRYSLHAKQGRMTVSEPALRLAQRTNVLEDEEAVGERDHTDQAFGQQRRRIRYNEETGLATGPYFESLTFEEFMAAIEAIVPYWQAELGLSDDRVGDLKHDARCMKASGDWKDLDILSQLMAELVQEHSQEFRGLQQVQAAKRISGD